MVALRLPDTTATKNRLNMRAPTVAQISALTQKPSGRCWILTSLSSRTEPLSSGPKALQRTFKFKTFGKAWDFMTSVSIQAKLHKHHPEWSNVYNTVFVRWTTHENPSIGVTERDVLLATKCDEIARELGEVEVADSANTTTTAPSGLDASDAGKLEGIADELSASAMECCVPRKEHITSSSSRPSQ